MRNWILYGALFALGGGNAMTESPYGPLSEAEKKVILEKGTEPPFTNQYDRNFTRGVYACRNCGTPLYVSDDKFDSGCGWPAFDAELPNAVRKTVDSDGRRTEITCAQCGAHLGHVFVGERLTPADVRHCVNSTSLVFEPQNTGKIQRAVFAGGCFWGVEELMRHQKGVVAAVSGYTGGLTDNPTYQQVCSGKTGHTEAVEIFYDPRTTNYETLCKYFLEIHDPTQENRQGPDIGSQYRSAIFYLDDSQKATALHLLNILKGKGYKIKTTLKPFRRFWIAENYHQDYYEKNGKTPYCHMYQKRFEE